MHKKYLILILILNYNFCYSQKINGTFYDNRGFYLNIDKDYVEFFLPFTTPPLDYTPNNMIPGKNVGWAGHGKIIFDNQNIIIEPKPGYIKPNAATFNFIPDKNKSGNFIFRITDTINHPLELPVGIHYFTKSYCKHCPIDKNYMTNEKGEVEFKVIDTRDSIIDFENIFGFQETRIKLKNLDGGEFNIQMKPGIFWYDDLQKITLYYEFKNDTLYYRYEKIREVYQIKTERLEFLIKKN